MKKIINSFDKFGKWFNRKYYWFFTNGMKQDYNRKLFTKKD